MVGLNAAGKTTVLYKLKLGGHIKTVPTIDFNYETIDYKGLNMNIWDVPGHGTMSKMSRCFFNNKQGAIFGVDSNDTRRIDEAGDEIHKLLDQEELRDSVLLVFANKQDLSNAIKPRNIGEKLKLNTMTNRPWHIQGACATTGDGIYEGLDWLGRQINERF